MKKTILFLVAVLCLVWTVSVSGAEKTEETGILGTWYYASYEDSETYPGVVFTADGDDQYFSVYTDGEKLMMIDNRNGRRNEAREAAFGDGVLTAGYEEFTAEDGKLVRRYGSVTETYTREPQAPQIPQDMTRYYADALQPEHYNGTWTIVKYGTWNAFADAETMNMTGKAVIENGKITITWTRDGQEKTFELTFDEELKDGCLYTVVNGSTSYIISMRDDHTILLNVGLYQSEWVMRLENVVDETVVHPDVPGFEQAFAGREDWTSSDETRNELVRLLFEAAAAGGADPAAVRADGPFYLALVGGDPAYPVLICEGTGDHANYLLTVGRGVYRETGEPFVYYHWTDRFFSSLENPEENIVENYVNEILSMVSGNRIWPVTVLIS